MSPAPDPFADRKSTDNDLVLARAITMKLLSSRLGGGPPYRLSIDHDVSAAGCKPRADGSYKPHSGPCPVTYEWQHGREVGIKTAVPRVAEKWIAECLMHGYSVARLPHHGGYTPLDIDSIEGARATLKRREHYAANPIDDQIPF